MDLLQNAEVDLGAPPLDPFRVGDDLEEDEEDEGDDEEEVAEIGVEAFTAAPAHTLGGQTTPRRKMSSWFVLGQLWEWMLPPAPIKPVNCIGKGSRTSIVGSSQRIVGSSITLSGRFKAGGS